jgi:ORF6N domain
LDGVAVCVESIPPDKVKWEVANCDLPFINITFTKYCNKMAKNNLQSLVLEQKILNRIYVVRGEKVMLDKDLAEMYGVETRTLNQSIKRNIKRFPKDFMYQLSEKEFANLVSQNVTSSWQIRFYGTRYCNAIKCIE